MRLLERIPVKREQIQPLLPLFEKRFQESAGFDKVLLGNAIFSLTGKQDSYVAALKEILSVSAGQPSSEQRQAIELAGKLEPIPEELIDCLKQLAGNPNLGFRIRGMLKEN